MFILWVQIRDRTQRCNNWSFLPKPKNPNKVVAWENLFPSCLWCNRKKNNREEKILNPCKNEPREYLGINKINRYRFKSIDMVGDEVIGLNNIQRVMVTWIDEWEALKERLMAIETYRKEEGLKRK